MSSETPPRDLVAIFHASFHPTKGNTIDWSLKASDDISLDNVEFNVLPSGLHLVEEDVVYFAKDRYHGVCVFRQRKTSEAEFRGARLESLGVLVAPSSRDNAWRHVSALKDLVERLYSREEGTSDYWEPARTFFDQHKGTDGAAEFQGWSYELNEEDFLPSQVPLNPTLHLPHLLRILGPSSITLYKYAIGRKRILIYTSPPVEAACILCHVAADMCFEAQFESVLTPRGSRLKGRCKEGIKVLGMVTLMDVDRLQSEGRTGRGWIACTTDKIFLERPSNYDLLIDLTQTESRPALYASKGDRLTTVRFAWSDVKLWNELDRLLQRDQDPCCPPDAQKNPLITAWTDIWRVYEDVCIVCASLWLGWRGNNYGDVRLEGADDLILPEPTTRVRSLGNGIEGRPPGEVTTKAMQRASTMSWRRSGDTMDHSDHNHDHDHEDRQCSRIDEERRDRQMLTTLALLQTFHAHTLFQLSTLESFLPSSPSSPGMSHSLSNVNLSPEGLVIVLTPKDVVAFELGPLSSLDTKYLEWLTEEYGAGTRVVIKKGWRDVLGLVLGLD